MAAAIPPSCSAASLTTIVTPQGFLQSQAGSVIGLGRFSFSTTWDVGGESAGHDDDAPLEGGSGAPEGGTCGAGCPPREKSAAVDLGDDGLDLGSRRARCFVFFAFSLMVQGFMSYSGGATPASLPAILEANPGMSQFEISLLGSLDKIGQVIASPFWGRALQRCPTKALLAGGLICNAAFSLQFGFVRSKYWMMFNKFMQGCTESQQIVWGNLWTTSHAPHELLSTWMNMGGVAAGIGTAVGQAVAGFGISANLHYWFAYIVQASALALLWAMLVFTPARLLTLPRGMALSASTGRPMSTFAQLRVLFRKRLYWYTMLCVAENNFITGGFQFFWTRFFTSGPWTLPLRTVTLAGLIVQGVGMGLGIFLGPMIVNSYGGYHDDLGRYITLHLLLRITAVSIFGSAIAIMFMGIQLGPWSNDGGLLDSSLRNPWLWGFWLATVPINFALSAQGGVQTVINIASAPKGMQELAQGVTTSVQFLFGYAGGVIFPSVILDLSYYVSEWMLSYTMTEADQLATGLLVVCTMTLVLWLTVLLAMREARRKWERHRSPGNANADTDGDRSAAEGSGSDVESNSAASGAS